MWVFRGRQIAEVVVDTVSPAFRSGKPMAAGFPPAPLLTVWLPMLMLYTPVSFLVQKSVVSIETACHLLIDCALPEMNLHIEQAQ